MSASPDWDNVFIEAALEPDRWSAALEIMASQTRSSHGQLIGIGTGRQIPFNLVSNFDADILQNFIEIDGGSAQVNFRVAASQEAEARGYYDPILYERHYDAMISQMASQRYEEWCDEIDIPFGCQTNLVVDGAGVIGFAALRKRTDGRTTAADRRVFEAAAQAARRAVRLQERLEGQQARFLAGAYEAIGICAFIIDARGHLVAHTEKAEALFSTGAIRLSGGMLDADCSPISLRQLVRVFLLDLDSGGLAGARAQIRLPTGRRPLLVEGFRLPQRNSYFGRLPQAVLIVNPPRRDRAGTSQLLSALFQLTASEADIAIRLTEGRTRDEIAATRRVTRETLRGQIKATYSKCGVDNESALMRLLAGLTV